MTEQSIRTIRRRVATAPVAGAALKQPLFMLILLAVAWGCADSGPTPPSSPEVTTIEVTAPGGPTFMGDTLQLNALVKDQYGALMNGQAVTWSSGNPALATVDETGRVIAIVAGSVSITAAVGTKTGTREISITGPGSSGGASGTALIGRGGGTVPATLPGGGALSLNIPPGALAEPVQITIEPRVPPAGALGAFSISPGGLTLAKPGTLVIEVSAGAKVRPTTTLVFEQEGKRVPVPTVANVAGGTVSVSLSSLGLASGAASSVSPGSFGVDGATAAAASPSQATLLNLALAERFEVADSALKRLQRFGTIPMATAMEYAMESLLTLDASAAVADRRFGPLLFDWLNGVCGFTEFSLNALRNFGFISDYEGLARVIGEYVGWTVASAAVQEFAARVNFGLTCPVPVPDAEAEVMGKLQANRALIVADLNAFGLTPSPRDSLFFADRLGPLLTLSASLLLASFDPAAQLIQGIVSDQLQRVRVLAYGDCLNGSQTIQARLIRALAAGGIISAAAPFSTEQLEEDIETCGVAINWRLRDSNGDVTSSGLLGGSPAAPVLSATATLAGAGALELRGPFRALICPSPASANSEQFEVLAGLTVSTATRVALLTPSNQNTYLEVSPLSISTATLRSAAGVAEDEPATVRVVMQRIGGVCSGLFANLQHSPLGVLELSLTEACPDVQSGIAGFTLAAVCAPPVVITSSSLPNGFVGVPYSQALTATGGVGDFQWSVVAGALPAGLDLDPSSGSVIGTPTNPGSSSFTVRVESGEQSVTQPLSLAVHGVAGTWAGTFNGTFTSFDGTIVRESPGEITLVLTQNGSQVAGTASIAAVLASATGTVSGTFTGTGIASFSMTATSQTGCAGTFGGSAAVDPAGGTMIVNYSGEDCNGTISGAVAQLTRSGN